MATIRMPGSKAEVDTTRMPDLKAGAVTIRMLVDLRAAVVSTPTELTGLADASYPVYLLCSQATLIRWIDKTCSLLKDNF